MRCCLGVLPFLLRITMMVALVSATLLSYAGSINSKPVSVSAQVEDAIFMDPPLPSTVQFDNITGENKGEQTVSTGNMQFFTVYTNGGNNIQLKLNVTPSSDQDSTNTWMALTPLDPSAPASYQKVNFDVVYYSCNNTAYDLSTTPGHTVTIPNQQAEQECESGNPGHGHLTLERDTLASLPLKGTYTTTIMLEATEE